MHIPSESRITIATKKKRSGRPKRPPYSVSSIVSNLHLLLRVPSFARWPLKLHFFDQGVHNAWLKWCRTAPEQLSSDLVVVTDFPPSDSPAATAVVEAAAGKDADTASTTEPAWGIHALPLDYTPLRSYVAKVDSILSREREECCVVCDEHLPPGRGLYAACPNAECEGIGHLSCWGQHLLGHDNADHVLPVKGQCPKCRGLVRWGEMMTELSLRVRGREEVEKLLKEPRKRKARKARVAPQNEEPES